MSTQSTATEGTLKFNINNSWTKSKILILDAKTEKLAMVAKCEFFGPGPEFRSADEKEVFGSSKIHSVGISPDVVHRGRRFQLQASERLRTRYEYNSTAFGDNVTMQWTSDMGLRYWNFVCTDEKGEAVAKLACDMYAVRKIATLEIVGRGLESEMTKEEVVVTGVVLLYEAAIRTVSLPKLFGAVFGRVGASKGQKKGEVEAGPSERGETVVANESNVAAK